MTGKMKVILRESFVFICFKDTFKVFLAGVPRVVAGIAPAEPEGKHSNHAGQASGKENRE